MENIPLPEKFEVKKIGEHQADVTIEPCYPGFGTTIGNALRRVLLSSLSGAAVTAVNIKGVTHEFSTIPGVKEDVVEILLNLKKLRFKLHSSEESRATLKIKGEKKVKAKDLKTPSDLEIINGDCDIATITDKNAELEIELTVMPGRGYIPVENMDNKKLALGTIAVDAIFTPIKNVNFNVVNVRVGQMTNFDRVILTISTDGTISPEDAIKKAAKILTDHFSHISEFGATTSEAAAEIAADMVPEEIQKTTEGEESGDEKPKKKRGRPRKEQ
jgi:DNA-directed RNA polymerase subunit alpha